jgi:hypothetical protein
VAVWISLESSNSNIHPLKSWVALPLLSGNTSINTSTDDVSVMRSRSAASVAISVRMAYGWLTLYITGRVVYTLPVDTNNNENRELTAPHHYMLSLNRCADQLIGSHAGDQKIAIETE